MASFKAHLSSGVVLGLLGAGAALSLAIANEPSFLIVLFLVMIVGALMPDIDSDSGTPFHVTFGSLSAMVGIAVFSHVLKSASGDYLIIIGYPIAAMVFMWVIVGSLFRKFTHHRGMAHSIPAALIAGLLTFFIAGNFGFSEWDSFLLSVAMLAGYILHLLLDEMYAAVNFGGLPMLAKSSLGSALKLYSRSKFINLAIYVTIVFLLAENWEKIATLSQKLTEIINMQKN
jgi:membrane-bound metal-dependent hydrolase YbcI (DUF457 family)